MTLKQHMTSKGIQQKAVERDLTMLMRSYDRECDIMTANRLNSLRAGRNPRAIELRALLEYSNNLIDSFSD